MIDKLIKLANELDLMGLIDEADSIDKIAVIMSLNMETVIDDGAQDECVNLREYSELAPAPQTDDFEVF